MDLKNAISANINGARAALALAVLTFISHFLISSLSNNTFFALSTNENSLDIIFLMFCAYGILKNSRLAALIMLVTYLSGILFFIFEYKRYSGFVISLMFLYFFINAVRGTFYYHKIMIKDEPKLERRNKFFKYLGLPIFSLYSLGLGIVVLQSSTLLPSSNVQYGAVISKKDVQTLIDNNIINYNDEIQLFYSYGLISILNGGNIITNDRVIIYLKLDNDEVLVQDLYFDEIAKIEILQKGNFLNDTIIKVWDLSDQNWIPLAITTSSNGDKLFINTIIVNSPNL